MVSKRTVGINHFVGLTILATLISTPSAGAQPDVQTIIQRSVAANKVDWDAAPNYSYTETDLKAGASRTYDVTIIGGSPYRRLIKLDNEPLSAVAEQAQRRKLASVIRKRGSESSEARQQRIAAYDRERRRDHTLMMQLSKAFDFTLAGRDNVASHDVYVLSAMPRKGYSPPDRDSRILLGMQGQLWIDTQTFQWVKVKARVVHPISVIGFLAQVLPGTEFELEKMPVAPGVWLPKHLAVAARSRILSMIGHQTREDETYSDYRLGNGSGT